MSPSNSELFNRKTESGYNFVFKKCNWSKAFLLILRPKKGRQADGNRREEVYSDLICYMNIGNNWHTPLPSTHLDLKNPNRLQTFHSRVPMLPPSLLTPTFYSLLQELLKPSSPFLNEFIGAACKKGGFSWKLWNRARETRKKKDEDQRCIHINKKKTMTVFGVWISTRHFSHFLHLLISFIRSPYTPNSFYFKHWNKQSRLF